MQQNERKHKIILSLQKRQDFSQEEIDDLTVEIIAEAIRNMRRKKPRKN